MARILVVDDEPDVRELFNITLKMAGHVTETAKDGLEALDSLNGDLPDLILLDLMMPRLDGFGLLTHIREKMATKPVRVLVATAKVLEDADNQRLANWPVVGVLNKGELDISAMVIVISNALKKEPLSTVVEKETASESSQDTAASTTAPSSSQPTVVKPESSPRVPGSPLKLTSSSTVLPSSEGENGNPT